MNSEMQDLPGLPLYRAAQMRELDRLAIEEAGIPGYTLMTRAATAAWDAVCRHWPDVRDVLVLCGGGNNGGDGFVLARLALQAGCRVRVILQGDPDRIAGDADTARRDWLSAGGEIGTPSPALDTDADIIVDALLGTGFSGALAGQWQDTVEAANASGVPIIALDIPSGLSSDTGHVEGSAIRAAMTVTFIGRKPGLYSGTGPACCGQIEFADLEVPAFVYGQLEPAAILTDGSQPNPFSLPRCRTAHKGDFGHILVVGGDHGMNGAVRLAGEAALRSGAGRVSVATRTAHAALTATGCPELMCHGVENTADLRRLMDRVDVVVAGPGLGQSAWGKSMLATVLDASLPLVLDADALNLLARQSLQRDNWILTPHPAEAARLLSTSVDAVQRDRLAAAQALQQDWGGVVVLKGAGTVIQESQGIPVICAAGNPGMASAGMGDVLSGIAGALVGQGISQPEAARAAVCLHAAAGDRAARGGERGTLARDLITELPALLRD